MKSPTPSPRRLEKAGVVVVVILAVAVVLFFVLRLFWHDEVQETDPASLTAPEATIDAPVQAPLESE